MQNSSNSNLPIISEILGIFEPDCDQILNSFKQTLLVCHDKNLLIFILSTIKYQKRTKKGFITAKHQDIKRVELLILTDILVDKFPEILELIGLPNKKSTYVSEIIGSVKSSNKMKFISSKVQMLPEWYTYTTFNKLGIPTYYPPAGHIILKNMYNPKNNVTIGAGDTPSVALSDEFVQVLDLINAKNKFLQPEFLNIFKILEPKLFPLHTIKDLEPELLPFRQLNLKPIIKDLEPEIKDLEPIIKDLEPIIIDSDLQKLLDEEDWS